MQSSGRFFNPAGPVAIAALNGLSVARLLAQAAKLAVAPPPSPPTPGPQLRKFSGE